MSRDAGRLGYRCTPALECVDGLCVSLRYFTLFMNLLNDCSEVEDDGQQTGGRKRGMSRRLASLRHCTVLAMSNLLNANVDSGLMHSIGERGEAATAAQNRSSHVGTVS